MKIIILTDQLARGGGAGVVAWNHAEALSALNHEVCVITTTQRQQEESLEGVKKGKIKIYTLYSNYNLLWRAYKSLNNPPLVKKLDKILQDVKPDIVHAHNIHLYFSYQSLVIARSHAKAVFLTAHDSMSFHYSKLFPETVDAEGCTVKSYKVNAWDQFKHFKWQFNPFRNSRIQEYLRIPDKIFAVSSALSDALRDNGIQNVEVLHNGIAVEEWGIREKPIDDQKDHIFFGGRLSRAKGGDVLMTALEPIFRTHPRATLLVVGEENEYTKQMKSKLGSLGEEHLMFTGVRPHDQMRGMYAQSALVTVPSLCFDWFPTNILEAMASGKPVIATCFGGSKEMVVDGKTGYVINPQNPQEIEEKITYLLDHSDKAREMGEAGFARVRDEFSMKKHMEKLLAWYDTVLRKN